MAFELEDLYGTWTTYSKLVVVMRRHRPSLLTMMSSG